MFKGEGLELEQPSRWASLKSKAVKTGLVIGSALTSVGLTMAEPISDAFNNLSLVISEFVGIFPDIITLVILLIPLIFIFMFRDFLVDLFKSITKMF